MGWEWGSMRNYPDCLWSWYFKQDFTVREILLT